RHKSHAGGFLDVRRRPTRTGQTQRFKYSGGENVAYQWVDCDRQFISQRYDRIAGLIPVFDWLFFLPPGLRRMAVERLGLRTGDGVLEVGCGTGRNFPHLRHAVGANGQAFGVDLSAGMLAKARELRHRERWTNIELTACD